MKKSVKTIKNTTYAPIYEQGIIFNNAYYIAHKLNNIMGKLPCYYHEIKILMLEKCKYWMLD